MRVTSLEPIAVIRSSAALLHRVIDSENTKGNNALARVDHASKTMADLTETLLVRKMKKQRYPKRLILKQWLRL